MDSNGLHCLLLFLWSCSPLHGIVDKSHLALTARSINYNNYMSEAVAL